jgi:hypothetical protein
MGKQAKGSMLSCNRRAPSITIYIDAVSHRWLLTAVSDVFLGCGGWDFAELMTLTNKLEPMIRAEGGGVVSCVKSIDFQSHYSHGGAAAAEESEPNGGVWKRVAPETSWDKVDVDMIAPMPSPDGEHPPLAVEKCNSQHCWIHKSCV